MTKTEIYTSKEKAIRLLIISSLFIILGICFVIKPNTFINPLLQNPYLILGLGVLAILFFGFGIYVAIKTTIKTELALVIDAEGIHMYPKKANSKLINWESIVGFSEIKINSQKIIIIKVYNPEYWLLRENNMVKKKMMRFNFSSYGSPLSISTGSLEISHKDLMRKLEDGLKKKEVKTKRKESTFFVTETGVPKK